MMTHPIHLHGMWSDVEDEHGNFHLRKHTVDMPPGSKRSYRVRADALGRGLTTATCSTTWKQE
jgi:FtsP/CotA-like multicopper oxidase with cupredoxin domain